jgi:hypothetical protein
VKVAPVSSIRHAGVRGASVVLDNPAPMFIVQHPKGDAMRRFTLIAIAACLVTMTLACSSMTVRADHDFENDFSRYESFAMFERLGTQKNEQRRPQMSPLVDRRIASAMAADLQAKGFTASSPREADFLVTFYTAVRKRVVIQHAGWYGWRRWGWHGGARWVNTYPEGTLVIDIIDRRDRQLVWRGVGQGAFTNSNPSDEKVAKRVSTILKTFPPTL